MAIPGILTLSDDDLGALGLTPAEIADAIERTLRKGADGALWSAPKSSVEPGDGRFLMTTLSAADSPRLMVVKSVLQNPRNRGHGHAAINGAILLLDGETGLLRCVMEANWITGVRTAGLSAVAARRLADPRSSVIACLGCGLQARSHLDAFADLFPLTHLRAFGRGAASLARLCEAACAHGLAARACTTAREAVEGADLVVTSIPAAGLEAPFLDARWLRPGAFVAAPDRGRAWRTESLPAFTTIVIDDHAQEAAAPARLIPADRVSADLTELATGTVDLRFDPEARSAFIFRGMAAGDFAVAALAHDRAVARQG